MSTTLDFERQFLMERLQILRTNLARLELRRAEHGGVDAPLIILNEIDKQKREITEVEERLRAMSVVEPPKMETPHNLPHALGSFVGRKVELQKLREHLEGRWFLICIEGIGGIGKTSLAIEVAHRALERQYFGGVVWATAKDRRLALNDLLNIIARVLGHDKLTQLGEENKLDAVHQLLHTGRYLIIVDNFETVEDERVLQFVTEIPDPSKALVTSRQLKIPSALLIHLKGMPDDEALTLIRQEAKRLGLDPIVNASDTVLARLYEGTGGVPLAIKWSLGQMRQKGQTLNRVLSNLYRAKGDVFEAIFRRSFEMLTFSARQVLRSMLVFSARASRDAISAVSCISEYELDEALEQLAEMQLVDVSDLLSPMGAHYDLHPLTRAFARRELLEKDGLEGENTYLRWARYFLSYVQKRAGEVDRVSDYQAIEMEHANIFAVLHWCYETGNQVEVERPNLWSMFVELVDGLADYLWARGYWSERVDLCEKAYRICKFFSDWEGAGRQAYAIGWVYWEQGSIDMAQQWAQECQQAMKQANKPEGISLAQHLLGLVSMQLCAYEEANAHFLQALGLASSDRLGVGGKGSIMSELGHLYRLQNKLQEAKAWYEKCVAESEQSSFTEGIGISKGYLAQTLFLMGQIEEAETLYREALESALQVGRATTVARVHRGLAEVLIQKGLLGEAEEHAKAAIPIYKRLDKKADVEATQSLLARTKTKASQSTSST